MDLIPAPHLYKSSKTPKTDMDTSSDSDNDSVVQELTTIHYEEGELSDSEQDTSVNDPDWSSTEEQNAWFTLLNGLDTYPRHGYSYFWA